MVDIFEEILVDLVGEIGFYQKRAIYECEDHEKSSNLMGGSAGISGAGAAGPGAE